MNTQMLAISPTDDGPSPHIEAWRRAHIRLQVEFGEVVYRSWFTRLELDEVRRSCAFLSVPTRFLKSWIQAHYFEWLKTVIVDEIAGVSEISIDLRMTGRTIAPRINAEERPLEITPRLGLLEKRRGAASWPAISSEAGRRQLADGLEGSPLDQGLTFASFLVGQSNQLAYAAAIQVSTVGHAASAMFTPLYIHAAVGLGKTHLLQAVAHASAEAGRRVIYLTAEKFMYGFVSALKTQNSIEFKDKLRAIDVLVIDDVQFLQGKSTQHEFCHTLNALIDAGRQVIIAADRPPADLEHLDERVRSRFSGGLCVEMQALDEPLRVKILEARIAFAKVAQPGFDVSTTIVAMVARAIQSNARDLDGAVNRLVAHTALAGTALTLEAADSAIRDLVRTREPRRVKIDDIQKLVATHFNVSRADVLSSRRTANVVRPRQVAMYLSKTLTSRSLPEIGRLFGGRDHTTVLHAVRKIEGLLSKDRSLSDEVALLKRMLGD